MGGAQSSGKLPPLQAVPSVNVGKLMGTWFVIGVMPTIFERGAHSAREIYTAGATAGAVDIDFTYCKNAFDGPLKSLPQKGSSWFGDKPSAWKVSPFWPIKMPYLVIDLSKAELDKDDAWFVVGYPSRAYVWIMARQPKMDDKVYEDISKRLVEVHHYPAGLPDLVRVPHQWTEAVGADGKPTYERSAK